MPKLSHVRQQLKARAEAPRVAQEQASQAQSLAKARADAEAQLISRIRDAVGFKETDLSPVTNAIATLPKPEKVDLGPVLARLEQVSARLGDVMAQLAAEGKTTRASMPKAPKIPKTDLTAVLNDLQWLKSFIALKKDPVIPEPKREWTFTVERDRNGFIKTIKAE